MSIKRDIVLTDSNYNPHNDFPNIHPMQGKVFRNIQDNFGRKTYGFLFKEDDKPIGYSLIIEYKLFYDKKYLYSPYGPYFLDSTKAKTFFELLIKNLDKENIIFFRFVKFTAEKLKNSFSFHLSSGSAFSSESEKVLSLSNKTNEIFEDLHPKLRYAIRRAKRREVEVKIFSDNILEQFESFYNLLLETKSRNTFSLHTKEYICNAFKTIEKNKKGFLCVGYIDKEIASMYLILLDNKFAYYLYGGSSTVNRKNSVSEYTMWCAIKHSKECEANKFYLGGVDSKKLKNITSFKTKFEKTTINYEHIDYIYDRFLYILYTIYKKIF